MRMFIVPCCLALLVAAANAEGNDQSAAADQSVAASKRSVEAEQKQDKELEKRGISLGDWSAAHEQHQNHLQHQQLQYEAQELHGASDYQSHQQPQYHQQAPAQQTYYQPQHQSQPQTFYQSHPEPEQYQHEPQYPSPSHHYVHLPPQQQHQPMPQYHEETIKTVTIEKKVPVPYTVEKHVPYTVHKKVPYEVKVPIPQPYVVEKKVPYTVKEYVKVKEYVPEPYNVYTKVPYEVKVPVDRPYKVEVPVPKPYIVEKKVPYEVKVSVPVPYTVEKKIPYEVKYEVSVPKPYTVIKKVPYEVKVPFIVRSLACLPNEKKTGKMDSGQFQAFQTFLERQTELLQQLVQSMQLVQQQTEQPLPLNIGHHVTKEPRQPFSLPRPLSFEGNMEENFDLFVQSWKDYSKAIGMDHWPAECNAIRVSLLLAVIGDPAKHYNLSANELESPETALQAIRTKVIGKRNVIADLSALFKAKQEQLESIDDYAARLKRLVQVTKLRTLESEVITCKIVNSNKWQHLRTKMRTIADITMEKALDLCRAEEAASEQPKELNFTIVRAPEVKKKRHFRNQRSSEADKNKPNASVPWRSSHQRFLDTDFKCTDLYSWISGFVSSEQVTPSEFIQALTATLMEYKTKPIDEAGIDECVNLVFEKAISEPNCSDGYAKLAKELGTLISLSGVRFKNRLLSMCQKEFEGRYRNDVKLGLNNDLIKEESEELKVLDEERGQKRAIGTVRFIGELYNHGMLTTSIMHSSIKLLITNIEKDDNEYDEETLERLCKLLTTIGSRMEGSNRLSGVRVNQDWTNCFHRLDGIFRHMEQNQTNVKVRSMIQEVIDLHRNGWNAEQNVQPSND